MIFMSNLLDRKCFLSVRLLWFREDTIPVLKCLDLKNKHVYVFCFTSPPIELLYVSTFTLMHIFCKREQRSIKST